MCTLIVGIDRPRPGFLLLGANRDEAMKRPTLPPHVLVREPRIVAGRDILAGGTWLGVQAGELVVALLNRTEPRDQPSARAHWPGGAVPDRSRGLLCLDALRMRDARQVVEWVQDEVLTCRYAPFSLLVADSHGAWAAYWDGEMRVEQLFAGWHVLTHVDADDPFDPRVDTVQRTLRGAGPRAAEDLVPMLASHDGARSICLHAEGHGTVSSALLQVAWADPGLWRFLHAPGRPCVTPFQDVSRLLTAG